MDEILTVALGVAEGIEAGHAKGIFHRDVKPADLFITASGHARILDYFIRP
ncbi:MAG: hypothetical protein AB1714_20500 [Acidobacteriota bacterium]